MKGVEAAAIAESLGATAAAVRHGADVAGETIVTALCHAAGERRTGRWQEQLEHFLIFVAQRRGELGDDTTAAPDADRAELVEDLALVAIDDRATGLEGGDRAELLEDLALVATDDRDADLEEGDRAELVEDLTVAIDDRAAAGLEGGDRAELVVAIDDRAAAGLEGGDRADGAVEDLAADLADRAELVEDLTAVAIAGVQAELSGMAAAGAAAGQLAGEGQTYGLRRRARTIALKRLTKEEQRVGALLYPERNYWRPKNRGECANAARPCPFVGCKYHLFIDVNAATGSIKMNAPDLEVWQLQQSCALDVADTGGITLEAVGELLNITRERIRQVETRGLWKLNQAAPQLGEYLGTPLEDL